MLTRFAPSPTGYIHLGNGRTALMCYLFARKQGGKFMLRIDDTDVERGREEYVDAIKEDLTWLGLSWDQFARQSERLDSYQRAMELLKGKGKLYPCYETQEELDVKRKMQLKRGQPPIYDRAALKLTDEQKRAFEAEGRKPHWRFLLDHRKVEWQDAIRGTTVVDVAQTSDPVVVRENGMMTYMLPSAVDDMELGITHVIRGEDHISNTGVQIQMFDALGATLPVFAHNALIKTKEGKLSKRSGKNSLRELREEGLEPMAINAFMAKIGTSDPVDASQHLEELIAGFDLSKFGKSSTIYEEEDLWRLNTKLVHQMSFADAKPNLKALGLEKVDEGFWMAVRPNLEKLSDISVWWHVCREPLQPDIEDAEFTKTTSTMLPEGEITIATWDQWIERVKAGTGRKGKELFMPIRKALTAMEHGPELKTLLPLLGREKIVARLLGQEV